MEHFDNLEAYSNAANNVVKSCELHDGLLFQYIEELRGWLVDSIINNGGNVYISYPDEALGHGSGSNIPHHHIVKNTRDGRFTFCFKGIYRDEIRIVDSHGTIDKIAYSSSRLFHGSKVLSAIAEIGEGYGVSREHVVFTRPMESINDMMDNSKYI